MLPEIISVSYLLLYWAVGAVLAKHTFKTADGALLFSLSAAYTGGMLAAVPAVFALLFGFTLVAVVASGMALCVVGFLLVCHFKYKTTPPRPTKTHVAFWICVLPFICFTFYLLYTHVLLQKNGAYYTGQSGYGDTAMHLAFIKNIAVAGEMPPHYSLLAGQNLFGYPFLCESSSSVFLLFGAGLKFAYLLPCIPALCAMFGFLWLLGRQVLGSAKKASVSFFLFALGGGFGFVYFLGNKRAFQSIFTGFYTTPTNFIEKNIRWVNMIADLVVPQRATLMGWAVLFPALYLLYRFAFEDEKTLWLPLGLLAGCLPLVHTHSLLVLVLVSAGYFALACWDVLAKKTRTQKDWKSLLPWVYYAALAGAFCLPQLFGVIFVQTGSGNNFLRFHFNWVNHGEDYFWFYLKNIGVVYLLLLPALCFAGKTLRRWYLPSLLILIISELVVFQPNEYDNIKLLYIWFLYSCLLVGGALCDWLALLQNRPVRVCLLCLVMVLANLSGVLTLGREVVSEYQVFDEYDIAAANFIDENLPKDALFVTGQQHLNPVASLAGRDILCGAGAYVYFHGMDYTQQVLAARELYETPTEALLAQWGVDYLYISSYERVDFALDEAWYAARYPVAYQNPDITIYQITTSEEPLPA